MNTIREKMLLSGSIFFAPKKHVKKVQFISGIISKRMGAYPIKIVGIL
jgi:hypothetical protein